MTFKQQYPTAARAITKLAKRHPKNIFAPNGDPLDGVVDVGGTNSTSMGSSEVNSPPS